MPTLSTDLLATIGALVLEVVVIWICRRKAILPVDLGRPRLLPYNTIMLFVAVGMLVTIAHLQAVLTGQPVIGTGLK